MTDGKMMWSEWRFRGLFAYRLSDLLRMNEVFDRHPTARLSSPWRALAYADGVTARQYNDTRGSRQAFAQQCAANLSSALQGLDELGCGEIEPASVQRLDSIAGIRDLWKVASRSGDQVMERHFDGFVSELKQMAMPFPALESNRDRDN
jgi:hypothetical protein